MLIKSLRLTDFSCHEDLFVTFTAGINGIIGDNGTGKSALLDALRFLFTGQMVSDGSKSDNVRWGAVTATVSGVFSQEGVDYELTRQFGKRSANLLKTPDFEYIKQSDIEEFLSDITGTSLESRLNNVFVPQGAIDRILFSTDTERLKEFQQTVGLQRAAESEQLLGKEIHKYKLIPGLDEQYENSKNRIVEISKQRDALDEAVLCIDAELDTLRPFKSTLERETQLRQHNAAVQQAVERVKRVKERAAGVDERAKTKEAEIAVLEEGIARVKSVAEAASDRLADLRAADRAAAESAELSAQLNELVERQKAVAASEPGKTDLDLLDRHIRQLEIRLDYFRRQLSGEVERKRSEEEQKLMDRKAQIAELLKTPTRAQTSRESELVFELRQAQRAADGTCPTCLSRTDKSSIAKRVEELGSQLESLSTQLDTDWSSGRDTLETELRTVVAQLSVHDDVWQKAATRAAAECETKISGLLADKKALLDWRSTLERLAKEKGILEAKLSSSKFVKVDKSEIARYEEIVDGYHRLSSNLSSAKATAAGLRDEHARCVSDVDAAEAELAELGELADLPTPEQIDKARAKVAELSVKEVKRRELLDEIASLEVKRQHLEELAKSLKTQLDAQELEKSWVAICKRARRVLHVSGLPYMMMCEYASRINKRMRHYLNIWEAPFTVRLGDNLAFIAEFPDGKTHSAARLSGGQRIVASTSFRLAMADLVAGQIGLLVLDEPSSHLDKNNKEQLQKLLLKLKDYAGETGKQIILVTHEDRLRGFFDNVISFGNIEA